MTKKYTDETLVKGEKVLLNNRQSKWELYINWGFIVVPILSMLMTVVLAEGVGGAMIGAVVVFFSMALAIGAVFRVIGYYFIEFAVTNKKVLAKSGIFSRNTDELQLKKIEGCDVRQGLVGRMLGFGSIVVSGTGSQKVVFAGIDNPLSVKKLIDSRI